MVHVVLLAIFTVTVCGLINAWSVLPTACDEISIVLLMLVFELWWSRRKPARASQKATKICSAVSAVQSHKPENSPAESALKAAADSGDLSKVDEILSHTCLKGLPPICWNSLLVACAKFSDLDRAEEWLFKAKEQGFEPDVTACNAVIDACARLGDLERAEKWLEQLRSGSQSPNVASYSFVLHACAKVNNVKRAELWLERMVVDSVRPNAICYNSLIHAYAKVGEIECAAECITRMFNAGVKPTVISYSTLIGSYAKGGNVKAAEMWLSRMMDAGLKPDTVCYNMILGAYNKEENLSDACEQACQLYEQMCSNDVARDAFSFNLLINIKAKTEDIPGVIGCLREMRRTGVQADLVSLRQPSRYYQKALTFPVLNPW